MQRAFRRPLNPGELNRYMGFWENIKDDFDRFEDGVKEVLIAVLCSPNFIYLFEPEIPELEDSKINFILLRNPPTSFGTHPRMKYDRFGRRRGSIR